MCELPILYRDEDFIIIDKPSGLLVHRSEIDRRETRFALQLLRDQIGQRVYPVHRLDKPTSGVLAFALHSEAAGHLQEAFREKSVDKGYFAIVRGFTQEQATIDYALSDKREKEEKKHPDHIREPQSAVSHYQRLATVELPISVGRYPQARYSLVSVSPETGRKHQIRRHFHSIAHPIVGDTRYGEGRHNRLFREHFQSHRLLLWSAKLSFCHPYSGERITISTEVPEEIRPLFKAFDWPLSLTTMG
ncbi:MAG: pseudouridine synthase [Motiliproteus sp.]|nr:pseudouridine synthase [Motiliproteus sp.]MCW9053916.1 pseudouridine synthase [Motiliproteus sp.]